MGQLSDDILKWTLDINGSPARKELTQVSNATSKLERDNRALSREMAKLEAHGKKGSKEWKAYEAQIKQNNTAITANKKRMGELRKEVGLNNLSATELRKEMKLLKQQMDRTDPNTAKWKAMNKEYTSMQGRLQQVRGGMSKVNGVFGALKKMAPWLSIAAVGVALKRVFTNVIQTRTEFSRYQAVLGNTLGSQKAANKEFNKLQQFAATTPFQLNELTGSYVKLANQGFKPTMQEMRSLGDLAASMGKSFDQLTEAIIDAQVGENERLKEFGIRAQKDGDKIKYTFRGVTTEVDNNAESIRNYILSLGKMEGVAGGMAKISKTIGGALSNSGDAADNFYNIIGKRLEPALVKLLGRWTGLLNKLSEAFKTNTERFQEQISTVKNLETNLTPLIDEYELLQNKTELSADEQARIKTLITDIAAIAPQAITQFDKYGNAIAISTTKAREFIATQQALLKYQNRKAIEETNKALEKQQKKYDELKTSILSGTKDITVQTSSFGTSMTQTVALTSEEIAALNIELQETGEKIKQNELLLQGLTGDYMNVDLGNGNDTEIGSRKTVGNTIYEWDGKNWNKIGTVGDSKDAVKALEIANKQRILALEEQYGQEENMQKLLHARLLANELAYLQAKAELETDEQQKLDLQIQIIDAQNKYNEALRQAMEPLRMKKEAVEEVNASLLEEDKLLKRIEKNSKKTTAEQDELTKKITAQAQTYQDTIMVVSDGLFDMMQGGEDAFKEFGKKILIFALEQLKIQAQLAAAGVTVQSLAQPDSIATFGASGLARAAIIVGLIEAAFAAVEGLVKGAFTSKKKQPEGYVTGGFTEPGDKRKPVGVVHAGEWIAPQNLLKNPYTRSLIDILEYYRQNPVQLNVQSAQPVKKLADGGPTSPSSVSAVSAPGNAVLPYADPELKELLRMNIRASNELHSAAERLYRDGTYTRLLGRNGFLETQEEYERMRKEVSL